MYIVATVLFLIACFAFVVFGIATATTLFSLPRTVDRAMLDALNRNTLSLAFSFTYIMTYLFVW